MNEKWCLIGFLWHFSDYPEAIFIYFFIFSCIQNVPQETHATFEESVLLLSLPLFFLVVETDTSM